MKTLTGSQADGIARWAWQDPAGRVQQAITQVEQLGQGADQDGLREIGDTLTMLTRLASSVSVQLAGQPGDVIELRFNPAEKRDSHGRWTRFGGVGQAADVMMKNREGFSVSVASGGEPVTGYMVAQTDHTHTYPASILDDHRKLTRAIDDMLVQEKAAFRGRGDVYLGGWVHDGKLWLEPSDNIASRAQAEHEGRTRNQIAIWDVDNGEEIQTGGSGGGRITEHANPQGAGQDTGGLLGPPRGGTAGGGLAGSFQDPGRGAGGLAVQLLTDQLDLTADVTGLLGQLIDLSVGNEAWRKEKRDAHGQWTRGAGTGPSRSAVAHTGRVDTTQRRILQQRVVRQRQEASAQVAERIAEDKARKALEEARAEVERVTKQLKEEAKTESNAAHRVKLAIHALIWIAGGIAAALMAHLGVDPTLAGFASAIPVLGVELVDWKKKL
jgi:hypothetical protein